MITSVNKLRNEIFSTPILLIAWRRPKETNEVIKSLQKIKPKKLFIACDGAREGNIEELEKVKKTQEVIKKGINWNCDIKWKINVSNLGCKIGVSSAINWFFDNVSEGIILEDDIVTHPDFFIFCEYLLNKYRADKRVWCISGSNNQDDIQRGNGSYYFGKIPLIWGWATWKDRWIEYDINIKNWPTIRDKRILENIFKDEIERVYWNKIFENFFNYNKPDTWDYPWVLTCIINNGLTVIPNNNLINNIGFNLDATHTKWEKKNTTIMKGIEEEIIDPEFLVCDLEAEKYQFDFFFGGFSNRIRKNKLLRIKNKIKKILNLKINYDK
tara:strand:- start:8125 stop:9105 length:981 start_codon:yes stop_codon:yes gene_type:complete